jgi:DhnA family fructose-bisphosphate aldolase class Ia
MHTGKQIRMNRLWKHKRSLIIPFDHGIYSGREKGLEDPRKLAERIAKTGVDGILISPGILKQVASVIGDLGVMLRIDGGLTKYSMQADDYRTIYSVRDALKLGSDAVIVMTFVGTPYEHVSLQRLGETAADGDRFGVPVVAEVLPPALLENHFGRDMRAVPRLGETIAEEIAHVTRIGMEHGADIIKTRFEGSVSSFRETVKSCGVPVIVAGGPRTDNSDESLLRLAHNAILAGAAGIVFGRNVWQHPKLERMVKALAVIVHEEESVEKALRLLV